MIYGLDFVNYLLYTSFKFGSLKAMSVSGIPLLESTGLVPLKCSLSSALALANIFTLKACSCLMLCYHWFNDC